MSLHIKVPKHIKTWMARDKLDGKPEPKAFWIRALRAEVEADRQRHRTSPKDKSEKN